MRSAEEFEAVRKRIAIGVNDRQIAMETGVPRRTIQGWRKSTVVSHRISKDAPCGTVHDFSSLPAPAYCHLLGLYLGDGCISQMKRVWRLRIVLDAKYPSIIAECAQTMDRVMTGQHAGVLRRSNNCFEVSMYSKHWPCLFPQHGLGKKHHRKIQLDEWQQVLVRQAPEALIRGLIQSDGCRVIANDRGVRSIRYHFTNFSEDILRIFTDALDLLGIPWTRPTRRMIAVYRKAATARLDEFVGPKA